MLDQSGILGYWSFFLGYWDVASLKLGYRDIHKEFGILAMRNLGYWSFENGIFVFLIWDIGILAVSNWDIWDTRTPSNTPLL